MEMPDPASKKTNKKRVLSEFVRNGFRAIFVQNGLLFE
jgi:hypothetical protein